MVALLPGDVTFGSKRPPADEIDFQPQSTIEKNGYKYRMLRARQVMCIKH
jgi:hypothetical protein